MSLSKRFFTPLGIAAAVFGVLAMIGLGNDLIRSVGAGTWTPLSLGEFWASIDIGSLNLIQAVIQRYVHPALWDTIFPVLLWPTWVLPLGLGVILLILKQKPWHTPV